MKKASPIQLKPLSDLTFSQMFWLFGLFLFTLEVTETTANCLSKDFFLLQPEKP